MVRKQNKGATSAIINITANCGSLLRVKRAIGYRGLAGETLRPKKEKGFVLSVEKCY